MLLVSCIGGLLTMGVASIGIGVIAIIEGIIYLTKSEQYVTETLQGEEMIPSMIAITPMPIEATPIVSNPPIQETRSMIMPSFLYPR